MGSNNVNPLTWNVAIADPSTGWPTPEFQRKWAQQATQNAGTGTVTSVSVTVSAPWSVKITNPNTQVSIALTIANQSANNVYAGPATGSAAPPAFRTLVGADMAANSGGGTSNFLRADGTWDVPPGTGGGGTVTNVSASVPSELSANVTNPTTTPDIVITKANQNANLVWAGPSSGGAAQPTFRSLAPADIPGLAASIITSGTFNPSRIPIATDLLLGGVIADGVTITVDGSGIISAVGGGGSSPTLPLANGDTGGVSLIADGVGQAIGVPLGSTEAASRIKDYMACGLITSRPAAPNISPNATTCWYATDTGKFSVWTGSAWTDVN